MNHFDKYIITLNSAILNQNNEIQIKIIKDFIKCIDQSKDYNGVIQEILKTPIGFYLNDVISSQLSVLTPSLKLIRHLMIDINFRNYHFLNIFKNVLRVLIMFVQKNTLETSQVELFNIITIMDDLLKMYFSNYIPKKDDDNQHAMFLCLLGFIELMNKEKFIALATKTLTLEIYFHLLFIIEKQNYIFQNLHLINKVFNLADVFLGYLFEKYRHDPTELWFFKIMEVLLRLLRSCNESDAEQIKSFENLFYSRMSFILEEILVTNVNNIDSEIFIFCISILNVIVWSSFFSKHLCNKILKKVVKCKAHEIIFDLAQFSSKIREYTQCSMKIFLTALVMQSENSPKNRHFILDTFLKAHFPNSLIYLRPDEVLQNTRILILLCGCSFFKQELRHPLNASRIIENFAIILQKIGDQMDSNELWPILRIFAYFSHYAFLSPLEYAGLQKLSEMLLTKTIEFDVENRRILHPINKYIIHFAQKFGIKNKAFNMMILSYISQEPSSVSSRIGQIIPSSQILPFISSTDYNQVVNAVTILLHTNLKQDDLDFIVKQCFCNMEPEEIIVEGALHLINKNLTIISSCSASKIFKAVMHFLEARQKSPKYSPQCYSLMTETCANLEKICPNYTFDETETTLRNLI